MQWAIGIDVGGTTIKAARVNDRGVIERKQEVTTPKRRKALLLAITTLGQTLRTSKVKGIGIGLPGPFSIDGHLRKVPNLPLSGLHPDRFFSKQFSTMVMCDNDATCALLGEVYFGKLRQKRVIGLTLGTGVGGGVYLQEQVIRGAGTELGHIIIDKNGPKIACGHRGCLESLVSAQALLRNASGLHAENVKELYALAINGNKKAKKIFEEMGANLGIGIASLCNVFAPDLVILGGQVSHAYSLFSPSMKRKICENSYYPAPVRRKKFEDAGIMGAAALLF